MSSLIGFRYKKKYAAENGQNGSGARCSGKTGESLVIKVPKGTVVREAETGRVLADLSGDEPVVVARGGKGGWGNQHFATATRQIPRFARPGYPGERYDVELELKLLADVGLCGFPNVGKSTLISVVSAAKPEIANYHFTTLTPVLGVVRVDGETSFVMADIPGLIEGASEGLGLGHEFLRHVDRCRAIDLIVRKGRVGEVYNVGGHNERPNIFIVKTILQYVHDHVDEQVGEQLIKYVEDRKGHDKRYGIDPEKIKRDLGWYPETPFEKGIVLTIDWYLEHEEWMKNVTSGNYQKYYEEMYKAKAEVRA